MSNGMTNPRLTLSARNVMSNNEYEYDCSLGHCWEVFSGDIMVCNECDLEGEVVYDEG